MKVNCYSDIGKKEHNEDSFGYNNICCVVCDGVGGSVKGKKASAYITEFLLEQSKIIEINEGNIKQILHKAQEGLNALVEQNQDFEGMATTLAIVFLGKNGLFTAHAGDSRIYLFKPKQKLFWHTWDHSIVGSLLKNGELDHNTAANHPLKHRISKAFTGNFQRVCIQPELHYRSEIEAGDIGLICSDGVLESFLNDELMQLILDHTTDLNQKTLQIQRKCNKSSYDNNTAILFEFEKEDCVEFEMGKDEWLGISS